MDQAITRAAGAMPTTTPPAAAPRLVGEFEGFIDGKPSVVWADRTRMPNVGEKLYAGMAPAVGAGGYALTEERIDQEWSSLDGFKIQPGQGLADWDRARRVAFARAIERALAASAGAAARSWSILLTSANHGTVGPLGSTFPHAGEHHERVVVVEVPAAAGAPIDQVNLQLVTVADRQVAVERALKAALDWANEEYVCARNLGKGGPGTHAACDAKQAACIAAIRALDAPVAAQAGQVAPTDLQVRRATDELSLPELAEQFAAVEALGCDYTLSAKVCGKLFRAMTTPPDDVAGQVAVPGWISVDARLPDAGYCLATYRNQHGKLRIIRAKYARQFEIDAGEDAIDQGNCEYNEADDTFYLKAGWLECIDNWDDYSSIYVTEGEVTHWMPLPAAPSPAKESK